eukprot:gene25898-31275_t
MQRRAGAVEIKLQSYVLSHQKASFMDKRSDNTIVILPPLDDSSKVSIGNVGKELSFAFDAILLPKEDENVDITTNLDKIFATSTELLSQGYDTTCLLYCSKQDAGDSGKTMAYRFCRLLYDKLESMSSNMSMSTTQPRHALQSSTLDSVQVSVYEVLESQVRDLVSGNECKIRDGVGGQVVLDGLSESSCTSYAALETTLERALTGRTFIALGDLERGMHASKPSVIEGTSNINYTILGELGTTVIHIVLRQCVVIPHATMQTQVTRNSTLKLVMLPTSDLLTTAIEYSGYKAVGNNVAYTPNTAATNNLGITQIKASLKALSTLSRVVDNLALKSNNSLQKIHVPYRDSMLTRYLRPSLEGNCFLSMLTIPSCTDRELASRALRFAANIGQLYRVIWCREEVVMSHIRSNNGITGQKYSLSTVNEPTEDVSDTTAKDNAIGNGSVDFPVGSSGSQSVQSFMKSSLEFMQAQTAVESEISSLTFDLDQIERLRLASLASLMKVKPVKQYAHNVHGGFAGVHNNDEQNIDGFSYNTETGTEDTELGVTGEIGDVNTPSLPSIFPTASQQMSPSSMPADIAESTSGGIISKSKRAQLQQLPIASKKSLPPLQSSSSSKEKRATTKILLEKSKSEVISDESSTTSRQEAKPSRRGSGQLSSMTDKKGGKPLLAPLANNRPNAPILSLSAPSTPGRTISASTTGAPLSPTKHHLSVGQPKRLGAETIASPSALMVNANRALSVFPSGVSGTKSDNPGDSSPVRNTIPRGSADLTAERQKNADITGQRSFDKPVASETIVDASESGSSKTYSPIPGKKINTSRNNVEVVAELEYVSFHPPSGDQKSDSSVDDSGNNEEEEEGVDSLVELLRARLNENAPKKASAFIENKDSVTFRAKRSRKYMGDGETIGAEDRNMTSESKESDAISTSAKVSATRKKREQETAEDMDQSDGDDLTPLERAFLRNVARCNVAGVQINIQEGVNIHVKNNFERDGIQIAARNGSIPVLSLLHSSGGELSSRGPKGETLFHLAAYNGHVPTLRWLHAAGLLPEAVDIYGQTAAHVAARRGELAVLQYLHGELGVDVVDCEDFDGRKPIECIPRRGPVELQACKDYLQVLMLENMEVNELFGNTVDAVHSV